MTAKRYIQGGFISAAQIAEWKAALAQFDQEIEELRAKRGNLNAMIESATGFVTSDAACTENGARVGIGSINELVECYRTDTRSPYQSLRHQTRINYESIIKLILAACGNRRLAELQKGDIERLYDNWKARGKISMGRAVITILRAILAFGATTLEDGECQRVAIILHHMNFPMGKSRNERITTEQTELLISTAHKIGLHSIALAQAFQADCKLWQKDVIGEWVPFDEPGIVSAVIADGMKWGRGLRWEEIGRDDLILRHVTSWGGKLLEVRLSETQFVRAELRRIGTLPQSGPIVVYEKTGLPYIAHQFRRMWRQVADEAKLPKSVFNGGSRSGEFLQEEAEPEKLRATESL